MLTNQKTTFEIEVDNPEIWHWVRPDAHSLNWVPRGKPTLWSNICLTFGINYTEFVQVSDIFLLCAGGSRKCGNADGSIDDDLYVKPNAGPNDDEYVQPNSGPDGDDDDGSDYESVKSPAWLLPFAKHPKSPIKPPTEAG